MTTDDKGVRRLRRLLSQIIDQAADESDFDELAALLAERPELQADYLHMMQAEAALDEIHSRFNLIEMLGGSHADNLRPADAIAGFATTATDSKQSAPAESTPRRGWLTALQQLPSSVAGRTAWWSVAAALLVGAFSYAIWPKSYATLVAANDAVWKSGSHHELGERLGTGWMELEAGSVQIAFRSTAAMKIEGPARFRLDGSGHCQLERGAGLAYVPGAARGFSVDTPTMRVVDLGTSFRVEIDDAGTTNLHVLEGVVEATGPRRRDAIRLVAGEMAVAASGPEAILETYGKGSAPVRTSPRVAYRAKHPPALGPHGFRGDNRAYVFLERSQLALPYDVTVNCVTTGQHLRFNDTEGIVPVGERVDCFVIHSAPATGRHLVEGRIDFQGEILGVLADSDKLNATNELFGSPWSLRCQHPERGFENAPDENADQLSISADRRSLQIKVRTESVDQLRVLVRSRPGG